MSIVETDGLLPSPSEGICNMGGTQPIDQRLVYRCRMCNKEFHIEGLTHSRPFKCRECGNELFTVRFGWDN